MLSHLADIFCTLQKKCTTTLYSTLFYCISIFFPKEGFLPKWKLAAGGVCFLCCGAWACYGMGAFAFFCLLSLHCVFCTVAQLLGLVFPSLPVFASGGWGVCVGLHLLQGGPPQWTRRSHNLQAVRSVGCVWWNFMESLRKSSFVFLFLFFFLSVCEQIFILAWLIRMPLAGSCPNRGCHLIKSIICWLNLLELRRKRSVHTLSRPVCLSVSLTHLLIYPSVFWGRQSTNG